MGIPAWETRPESKKFPSAPESTRASRGKVSWFQQIVALNCIRGYGTVTTWLASTPTVTGEPRLLAEVDRWRSRDRVPHSRGTPLLSFCGNARPATGELFPSAWAPPPGKPRMTAPEPWDAEGRVAMCGEYPLREGCEPGNDEPHLAGADPANDYLIE